MSNQNKGNAQVSPESSSKSEVKVQQIIKKPQERPTMPQCKLNDKRKGSKNKTFDNSGK